MKIFLLTAILLTASLASFSQNKTDHRTRAATPPMGWNSYDAYYGSITEKQFLQEVDVIAKRLLPVGYEYAVIDYCWFNPGPKGWDPDKWITFDFDRPYTNKDRGLFNAMVIDGYGRLLPAVNRVPSSQYTSTRSKSI